MERRERDEATAREQLAELSALRRALAVRDVECNKLEQALSAERERTAELTRELCRKQSAAGAVLKELGIYRGKVEALEKEVEMLRAEARVIAGESRVAALAARREQRLLEQTADERADPAARFMALCFEAGADPDPTLLRSLHTGEVVCSAKALEPAELEALCEVLCRGQQAAELSAERGKSFTHYQLRVGDEGGYPLLAELARGNPTLTRLDVTDVTDRGLRVLLQALGDAGHVGELRLHRPGQLTDDTVISLLSLFRRRALESAEAPPVRGGPPKVRMLKVEELDLHGGSLRAGTMEQLHMDTLRRLDLGGQDALTDGVVEQIVGNCRNLSGLSVAGCRVSGRLCQFLNAHGERVTDLDLTGCGQVPELCLDHVRRLHTDLSQVRKVRCARLTLLPAALPAFPVSEFVCPQLQRITLHRAALGHREMKLIGEGSPQLLDLVLHLCKVQGLGFLVQRQRRLQRLCLRGTGGVVDADLASISATVEALDLTGCYYLTDAGLSAIAANCPELRWLSLQGVSNATDNALDTLGERCERIAYINLLGCRKVSVLGMDRLARRAAIQVLVHDSYSSAKVRVQNADPLAHVDKMPRGEDAIAQLLAAMSRHAAGASEQGSRSSPMRIAAP